MKKCFIFSFLVFLLLLSQPHLYAQIVKIIEIQGEVLIRSELTVPWEEAEVGMYLKMGAEIETKGNSECTLAFGEDLMNTFTIKEDSRIRIENLKPGEIYLPQGRVFSLIEDIENLGEFQIRTPTSIAGVRGSGWMMSFIGGTTSLLCFEGTIYVKGIDEKGNIVLEIEIREGSGRDVGEGGVVTESFTIGAQDLQNWDEFKEKVKEIIRDILEEEIKNIEIEVEREKDSGDISPSS